MFLTMFEKTQNIAYTMHLTMLIAHPYLDMVADMEVDKVADKKMNKKKCLTWSWTWWRTWR